jgi:hypothetical protein
MAWKWWRGRAKPPLRYFIYVSDEKLESHIDQIPEKPLRRLSVEAKVDLKVAGLAVKNAERPTATRMAKLKVVERYIDRHHEVGTLQQPGTQYFRARMPVRWGWLDEYSYFKDDPERLGNVAFFRGEHDGHTVVLVGSRHHVLGQQPPPANEKLWLPGYSPFVIFTRIMDAIDDPERAAIGYSIGDPEIALYICEHLQLKGPAQSIEFLAVPLLEVQLPEHHLVLATPIYVALADPASMPMQTQVARSD